MGKRNRNSGVITDKAAVRPRFGLQLKLLIASSVLILCVSSFFTTQFVMGRSTRMMQRADRDIETLSGILATSAELGVWARDRDLLEGPVLGVSKHPHVRYVALYDASGEPLFVCRGAAFGTPVKSNEQRRLPKETRDEILRTFNSVHLHTSVEGIPVHTVYLPITQSQRKVEAKDELSLFGTEEEAAAGQDDGRLTKGADAAAAGYAVSGFAEIETSLEWMHAEKARIVRSSVMMAAGVFGVAIVFILAFGRRITSPLAELVKGTEKIGEGDLGYRIELRTEDELGILAQSFNKMADQVCLSRREIEEYNRNLEEMVAERTVELEASESRFRSVFESSPIGILAADKDGIVTGINEAYLRILGVEEGRELVVGRFNLRDAEVFRSAGIDKYVAGLFEGYPFDVEAELLSLVGEQKVLRHLGVPLFDSGRGVSGTVLMAEDVTDRKRAEEALQESEEKYRTVIENISDVVFQLSPEGFIQYMSPKVTELYGYEPKELVGESFEKTTPTGEVPKVVQALERVLSGEQINDLELEQVDREGNTLIMEVTAAPIEKDGTIIAVQGVIREITERKRAEEALRIKDSAMASSINGVAIADLEGKLTYVNDSFLRLWGYSDDTEVLGRHVLEFWEVQEGARAVVEALRDKGSWRGELLARRKDGSTLLIELSASMVTDKAGIPLCMMASFVDITERKQAERRLLEAKNGAEDANRELAITNKRLEQAIEGANKMAVEAQAASVAKSEFLANMSHEIRTPLNGIVGMADLALDTELNAEQSDYMLTVKRCADSLLVLINDILDFSKVEAGRLEFEEIDFELGTTLEGAAEILAPRASEKGIELAVHVREGVPGWVRGDPGRLRQVIVNLCSNAIKFTERGEVVIGAEFEERDEDKVVVRFSVSDTGIGIPKEKQSLIFEIFRQGDGSTSRKYGGTGLGLAISKQLVELMGGRIWVESEPGTGSTFYFTVPYERQPERAPAQRASHDEIRDMLVLIVDDNRTARTILREMLSSFGCRTLEAGSGTEGLKLLRERAAGTDNVRLALLDANLPDMNGFDLARAIRQDKSLQEVGLVMLASMGARGDASRAQKAGISAYLTKPVKQSQLFDAIVTVLGLKGGDAQKEEYLITRHTLAEDKRKGAARILLAEDNPVNRKVAERMLTKAGYSVDVASNGIEVLRALERGIQYHVVLMDVQMPEMDGFEATAAIRRDERWRGIPIIAITAHVMKGDQERCRNAGMDDYIAKPIDSERLMSTIEKWIGGASAKDLDTPAEKQVQEPIDIDGAMERLGGDAEFLREVVEEFLALAPKQLETVRVGVKSGDAAGVELAAHTLKGAASSIHAEQVRAAALRLEEIGRKGDLSTAEVALSELDVKLKRLEDFVVAEILSKTGDM